MRRPLHAIDVNTGLPICGTTTLLLLIDEDWDQPGLRDAWKCPKCRAVIETPEQPTLG